MGETGGCHCGKIRYEVADNAIPIHHAICHCNDCRKVSGAPAVAWALFPKKSVSIQGETQSYASSMNSTRRFCNQCGTSLFYENAEIFPDQIDVQSATLDNPNAYALGAQVQVAERVDYMQNLHNIPTFDRYPEMN